MGTPKAKRIKADDKPKIIQHYQKLSVKNISKKEVYQYLVAKYGYTMPQIRGMLYNAGCLPKRQKARCVSHIQIEYQNAFANNINQFSPAWVRVKR
ncbi:MAG: hypothetical protein IJM09_03775 [Neisseriaceae bacterium]|nr:hypothetical protein [Neisseriaceae bacterium]